MKTDILPPCKDHLCKDKTVSMTEMPRSKFFLQGHLNISDECCYFDDVLFQMFVVDEVFQGNFHLMTCATYFLVL